jgi:membrane-bound lytic murein transglycosylase C
MNSAAHRQTTELRNLGGITNFNRQQTQHKKRMDKKQYLFVLILIASITWSMAVAEDKDAAASDGFTDKEALFSAMQAAAEGAYDERAAKLESLWQQMEAQERAKWLRLEKEVTAKWGEYRPTTKTVWVCYSPDREAYSEVDFASGMLTVAAVFQPGTSSRQQKQQIKAKLQTLLVEKDERGRTVMENMLPAETEQRISVGDFTVSEPEVVRGGDGVKRVKTSVTLVMVPDHISRRAARFMEDVKEFSVRERVDAALVLAVIHTESAFNPKARSPVPAYGLMQLVPRWAAKEAYLELHGIDKVLTADYLYHPRHNIELGVTYFRLLIDRYFSDIQDPVKRRYLAISAYNWGPTAVRTRLLSQVDVNHYARDELFIYLSKRLPRETRDYLRRVEERRRLYARKV